MVYSHIVVYKCKRRSMALYAVRNLSRPAAIDDGGRGIVLSLIAYFDITVQTQTCHSTSSSPLVPIHLHSRYLQQTEPCCRTAAGRSASKRQCRRKLYLLDEMPANQRKHWSTLHWTERHERGTECHVSGCDECVIRGSR